MPYPYSWTPTRLVPDSAAQVKVQTFGGLPAALSTPVSVTAGEIAFALTAPGRYRIVVQKGTERYIGLFNVDVSGVDIEEPEQYEYTRNAPLDPVAGDGAPVVPLRYIAEDTENPGLYRITDGDTGGRIVTVDDDFKFPAGVEGALNATYASTAAVNGKLGKKDPRGDMFLGFATALKNGNESTGLYVIGDSTTTPDTAWFRLLANQLATEFPAFTHRYWKWNNTTQKFDRPIELHNGGAKRAMVIAPGGTRSGRAAPGPNITGPIEGIVHMKAAAYVGDYFLLSKWTNDAQVSWAWRMTSGAGGWPQLLISTDGTTATTGISTGPANLVDGQEAWLKFNYTPNDGAGNRVTKFWKSTDGVTWTQIGTTQTTAGALVPFQSTSDYMVGARSYTTGAWPAGTEFYESWINDGIDGGPVVPVLPHTWPTSIGVTASLTTGAPQVNYVMGAEPGAGIGYDMNTVGYLADPVRLPKLTPDMGQQIAFFNTGHNEGQYGYRYRKQKYMAWVDAVTARMPGVQRIGMTQNPRTGVTAGPDTPGGRGHMADRAFMLSWARSVADLDVLDVWDAFVSDGRPVDVVLVGDGVHPTGEGYLLWKNYVKAEMDAALARVTV